LLEEYFIFFEVRIEDINEENHGVDAKIVRIFNTYGPRMLFNDGRVVSNFIVQALKGADITIFGDGCQTRSFCYVDDLVRGLISMMECDGFHGPVNLGNPQELSIGDLAKKIIEMTNSRSKLIFQDLPVDDPRRRQPDISLAKEKLAWSPTVDVAAGLEKTIADFDQRLRGTAL
jgi:UDP-glucuronate decarboxylase